MDLTSFKPDIDELIDEFTKTKNLQLLKVFLLQFSEELKKLRKLGIDAKENNIKVISSSIRKMLEANIFLFGFIDANEDSFAEKVNQLTQLQNARLQVAYEELFANTKIEDFLHMDLVN
ncbi:hypothetical protein C1H46_038717 [Malus baccata]|uniref:Uncharacterized protein n=1 Tax=Malus baccata TaxID=106549 RepID=A0A540KND5_MALBA|nr:hypothetical protein C1H46_038717 [Malus baccata]